MKGTGTRNTTTDRWLIACGLVFCIFMAAGQAGLVVTPYFTRDDRYISVGDYWHQTHDLRGTLMGVFWPMTLPPAAR